MPTAQQSVHLIAATVGFLSFFLCWLAIVWGLVLRNAWASTRLRHSTVYGVHHTVALLGLTLSLVHAAAQLAAPLGPVRLIDEFVPFLNPVDPIGIGIGVVGLEILLAAALSTLVQRRLGFSRWRAVHGLTYVAFMLVVGHVLLSGSDTGPTWVWSAVMVAWVSTLLLWVASNPLLRSLWRGLNRGRSTAPTMPDVTVGVDPVRCGRFGFCEQEAPEVFTLRGDGRLSYAASVPADQLDEVVRAMRVCPARAISVHHAPTLVMTGPPAPVADPPTPRDGQPRGARRGRNSSRSRRGAPPAASGLHRPGGQW
jgi:sulfoxide reductase heme-binding subunit YedZ